MNLSKPFIKRPVMTSLLMIAIFVGGIIAYGKLPISNLPNVTYPTINVNVNFPGTTPEMMAHAIALPLEKQFMAIPGVKLVSSNNTLGTSNIALQFNIDKDMATAAQDVQAAIIAATPQLPPSLPYAPTYRKVNPAELPILYIALTSETIRLTDLYTYANNLIGQRISMISGVSQVHVFGSPLAIRIRVDPGELASRNLSLTEMANALRQGNPNLSTGQLDGDIEAPNVAVDGQLLTGAAWNELIVSYRNGAPIRVKDLGTSVESFNNDKIYTTYIDADKEQLAILLAIKKEPTANTVAISDAINELIGNLKSEIPPAVHLDIFFDHSISIRNTISDVNLTLLIALILVIAVIFLYLGKIIDTLIPAIVLPLSVLGTFIFMHTMHYTLDNLSLLGLTLAVGFIVDDAIVVIENIVRHQEEGKSRWQASLDGARQIGFTIVSMTLSLVAVFLPMLLMGGLIGKIFREFAITLTAVTVISGFISLTLTPMLCSLFLPDKKMGEEKNSRFSQWTARMNHRMQEGYRKALEKALDHRAAALFFGFLCLAGSLLLFSSLTTDFVPNEDDSFLIVYTQGMEAGSSFRMKEYEQEVSKILKANPWVESFVAISSYSEYRKGQNLVKLKPYDKRPPIRKIIEELNQQLLAIPGIQAFIKNIPLIDLSVGQESRGDYQFAMQSIYGNKVYSSAKRMIAKMIDDPLFQGVNSDLEIDSPQVNINILRDKASSLGITATDIENAFLYGYSQNYVTRIQTAIDQYNVILELDPKYQMEMATFDSIWLRSAASAKLVPLSAVTQWEEAIGPSSINHIDQFPSVTVSYNLNPNASLEEALTRINELQHEVVDKGVVVQQVGASQTFQESVQNAGYLLCLAIFAIYIILGMLYESYIHPLTVLTTLPPATFGGLLVLLLFDLPLSMYSYLGILLLIGIVKKNGIMMVDFALENIRERNMDSREAILNACLVRFRPIMMTTMAAIFGAIPIAIGIGANGAARQPLGLVIIGGLLLSQLITLFVTPILYLMMERLNTKLSWSR